jgi:hypothetical protein
MDEVNPGGMLVHIRGNQDRGTWCGQFSGESISSDFYREHASLPEYVCCTALRNRLCQHCLDMFITKKEEI